ncbi:hypothetical protein JYU34_018585 [Plutella xylostella]|uniref:Uncharacterized protein n=1 Tax=Plutella xylostella TaxID=51655 RepID=A0ABQ7PZC7_PLUXY|nr:hypothetical protein JYU34_018585 [Plutella xylostella]
MLNSLTTLHEIDNTETARSIACQIEDLSKTVCIKNTDLTIISQNIRSIYKNIDDLQITLAQFDFKNDIIALTECRLDPMKPTPQIDNYNSFSTTCHLNKCDGVVAYVKNNHNVSFEEVKLTHASCLQLTINDVTVLCIYRSPSNKNAVNFINSLDLHFIYIP